MGRSNFLLDRFFFFPDRFITNSRLVKCGFAVNCAKWIDSFGKYSRRDLQEKQFARGTGGYVETGVTLTGDVERFRLN